ncbi:MAG TPA: hypothetical protein VK961_04635 [Chthoniobacter sp.]|nr:hypothetical protein [Chthoniobacter sp.]
MPPPIAVSSAAADPSAPSAGSGLTPNVAAALASFFLLIGGIVFILIEKKNQFVRFYAMQSIFLGGLWVALSIGMAIIYIMLHGIPLIGTLIWLASMAFRIVLFVAWVVMVIKAFQNKEWEIPYLGSLARQQLAKTSPVTP